MVYRFSNFIRATSLVALMSLMSLMVLGITSPPVLADEAARGWSQSLAYTSPSQQAVNYTKARDRYLLRKGIIPGANVVTNNSTQNCQVAGACQNGGEATNVNGYSSNTITGDNNTTGVDIATDGTTQDASAVSNVADEIGAINFN